MHFDTNTVHNTNATTTRQHVDAIAHAHCTTALSYIVHVCTMGMHTARHHSTHAMMSAQCLVHDRDSSSIRHQRAPLSMAQSTWHCYPHLVLPHVETISYEARRPSRLGRRFAPVLQVGACTTPCSCRRLAVEVVATEIRRAEGAHMLLRSQSIT